MFVSYMLGLMQPVSNTSTVTSTQTMALPSFQNHGPLPRSPKNGRYVVSPRKRKTQQNIDIRGCPAIQKLEERNSTLNGDRYRIYVGV